MRYAVWGLVLALIVLHQDNWNRENSSLVFGFIPVTLFYHSCISIASGVVWFLATKYAWPEGVDFTPLDDGNATTGAAMASPRKEAKS